MVGGQNSPVSISLVMGIGGIGNDYIDVHILQNLQPNLNFK